MAIDIAEETSMLVGAVGVIWAAIAISSAIVIGVSRHLSLGICATEGSRLSANFAESRAEESFEDDKVSKRLCLRRFE